MSLTQIPLTIVVAATTKNGIGKNGGLPWPMLKKDMAFFARVTKRVPMPGNTGSLQSDTFKRSALAGTSRNVVIMGRKTWDSIPTKFRPLPDRTNVIISTQDRAQLQPIPDDVVVAPDITAALRSLEDLVKAGKVLPVGRAFIIGGTSIYKAALELPQTSRILLTRVHKDYKCDTYFPVVLDDPVSGSWQRQSQSALCAFADEEIESSPTMQAVGEERIGLDFQLYERV